MPQAAVTTSAPVPSPAVGAEPQGRVRRYRTDVVVVAGLVAAYLLWLVGDLGGARTRLVVSDLVFVAAPLLAAKACWSAHRRRRGRHNGWAWLAAGCLTWAGGSVLWAFYELVLGDVAPFPSWADVGYIGYAVPVVIGLTRFARTGASGWSRWRLALDGTVVGGSLLVASLVWVLDPVVDGTERTLVRLDALAYPLADVAVAAVVLTRCMVFPQARRLVWVPLSLGLLTLTVTDSLYIAATMRGDYLPGGVVDVGYLLSFVLVGLAARAPVSAPERPPRGHASEAPTMFQQLLPWGTVLLAVTAVASDPAVFVDHRVAWLFAVPLALAAVARQVVVVADHTTLARDLSEAVEQRTTELVDREQWWRELVQNLSDVVVVIDPDGAVRYCSPSAATSLGRWPERVRTAEEMTGHVHPEDLEHVLAMVRPVVTGRARRGFVECRVEVADGGWGWFEVTTVGQLTDRSLRGTVLTLHDVSERRLLTDRLAYEASHDSLTGLPNRAMLMRRTQSALAQREEQRCALLLIDLDDFKMINDRHGHGSGDRVLEIIGRRLRATVRADDTVARLGGDEFALLMRATPEEVRRTAERLITEIEKPVVSEGRRFLVRASVGVVFAADTDTETPQSMLSHADIALYEAKANDKGGIVLIAGQERDVAAQRLHLREEIAAPDLDQFGVVYQPIVDLRSGRLRGVEALMRWRHPELGAVPPDDFIPMAEAGGSIQVLGWHVLTEACAQLAAWQRAAPEHRLAIGVNISCRQLDEPGFAERVHELVATYGLDPEQLVLELTEQSLALDFETAVEVVARLRAGGVSVAVDDYGTGYSSLRYLHRFDADVVKIDRSFIAYLAESLHTQKIVASVMDMAESLDLQSIAEGIETPAQMRLVRELGCELGQGYLFSRPVEADEISRMLLSGAQFTVAPEDVTEPVS